MEATLNTGAKADRADVVVFPSLAGLVLIAVLAAALVAAVAGATPQQAYAGFGTGMANITDGTSNTRTTPPRAYAGGSNPTTAARR